MRFYHNTSQAGRQAMGILLGLCLLEFVIILLANQGHFMFTLDDPYIHLALAENLIHGHYGVNLQEFSSPSSSIIWPFLIAPFTLLSVAPYGVLLLNLLFASVAVLVAARIIGFSSAQLAQPLSQRLQLLLLVGFIWLSNLVGLIFTGMEHSLQLLLCTTIVYGVIQFLHSGAASRWLLLAIVAAPLVRYECLAVSAPALLLLLLYGQWRTSLLTGAVLALGLLGFSLFLQHLGLDYLPSSVMVKSSVASSGLGKILANLGSHYSRPKAAMMLLASFVLVLLSLSPKLSAAHRRLAGFAILMVWLHLCFGRFGWYFRYEIYAWACLWLVLVTVLAAAIQQLTQGMSKKAGAAVFAAFLLFVCVEHLWVFVTTPISANNIYRQQYQMHRLVTEFYKKPVAVNDLGWVAYQNSEYVLDLWGLASKEALQLRKNETSADWMERLCAEHSVELIMIYHPYERWFAEVPASWQRIGQLNLGVLPVTAGKPEVSFFIRSGQHRAEIRATLEAFAKTLPQYSSFVFDN